MSHQDKDREAFEVTASNIGLRTLQSWGAHSTYRDANTEGAWKLWQSARDHYTPKLTAERATVALARFLALQEYHAHGFETLDSPEAYVGIAHKDHIDNARKEIEALCVAGVRFKDDRHAGAEKDTGHAYEGGHGSTP